VTGIKLHKQEAQLLLR